jgi:hypothetical protein
MAKDGRCVSRSIIKIAATVTQGRTMKITTAYQNSAQRYRELAEQAKYAEDREFFLKIADTWTLIVRDGDPSVGAAPRQDYEIRESADHLIWRPLIGGLKIK